MNIIGDSSSPIFCVANFGKYLRTTCITITITNLYFTTSQVPSPSLFASIMMKFVLLVALVGFAMVSAAPQADVSIVRSENDNQGDGQFSWAFETSDGTKQDQQGELKAGLLEDGTNGQFETVKGSYSYRSIDGRDVVVTYEADDKGYRAKTSVV